MLALESPPAAKNARAASISFLRVAALRRSARETVGGGCRDVDTMPPQ
jgi:hypothetical protein